MKRMTMRSLSPTEPAPRRTLRAGVVVTLLLSLTLTLWPSPAAAQVVIYERRPRRYMRYAPVVRRVPPGFHLETRPNTGMAIAGGVLSFIGTAFLVGGIVDASSRPRWSGGDTAAVVAGTFFDLVGLPLLITGLTTSHYVLVPNHPVVEGASFYVTPAISKNSASAVLGVAF